MAKAPLRDWYLAQLGVTPYRRRTPESCAGALGEERPPLESPRVENAATGLTAHSSSTTAKEADVPRSAIAVPEQSAGAGAAEDSAVVAAEKPAAAEYRARIMCWQTVADVLVLHAGAPGRTPKPSETTLLANILRAIKRLPGDLPAPEFIDWPPVAGTAGDIAGARINLAMFLAGRARVRPFQWVLAMGDGLRELLAPTQDLSQNRALLECGATAIFTPGLAVMVADPASKATTWAAIRFLEEG